MRGLFTMKNPLTLTLSEIETMMREAGPDSPELEFTKIVAWLHERQKYLADYAVQRERELVRARANDAPISHRRLTRLDDELLDTAEIVVDVIPF